MQQQARNNSNNSSNPQGFQNNLSFYNQTATQLRCSFLECLSSPFNPNRQNHNSADDDIQLLNQCRLFEDQLSYHLEQHTNKQPNLTANTISQNLLQFQKQLENRRYDFKGLEFEVFSEDVTKNDFKTLSHLLSKAHYVEKLSIFIQNSNISDDSVMLLAFSLLLNKSIKDLKLYIGNNHRLTSLSIFGLFAVLSLHPSIKSLELEANCNNIDPQQFSILLQSFLIKSPNFEKLSLNVPLKTLEQPNAQIIPVVALSRLVDLHIQVSNQIKKDDLLLEQLLQSFSKINEINSDKISTLRTFSLDYKNHNLTKEGIITLATVFSGQKQLAEIRFNLSGNNNKTNASLGLPQLGASLAQLTHLDKLEIILNDFNMYTDYFGEFIKPLINKQGIPFRWLSFSHSDNPNIDIEDEILLGELYAPNYLLNGIFLDITNNFIKIISTDVLNISQVLNIGKSIENFPNCSTLNLKGASMPRYLYKYLHIIASCSRRSLIQKIDSPISDRIIASNFILAQKLSIIALNKHVKTLIPVYLPHVIYDLKENLDSFFYGSFPLDV